MKRYLLSALVLAWMLMVVSCKTNQPEESIDLTRNDAVSAFDFF